MTFLSVQKEFCCYSCLRYGQPLQNCDVMDNCMPSV